MSSKIPDYPTEYWATDLHNVLPSTFIGIGFAINFLCARIFSQRCHLPYPRHVHVHLHKPTLHTHACMSGVLTKIHVPQLRVNLKW